jgi:hypothetical protein
LIVLTLFAGSRCLAQNESAANSKPADSSPTSPAADGQFGSNVAESSAPHTTEQSKDAKAGGGIRLEGKVSADAGLSPLLAGSVQEIPVGTKVDLKICGNLNSELNQKGDEIFAQVATNVANAQHVLVPGGWVAHGRVINVASPKHNGRAGYVEVQFDCLISPDKKYELPFEAKFSTQDKQLKAVAKVLVRDGKFAAVGAAGGALLAFQFGGVPLAVSTYGIDIGAGAAIGAGIGLYGAWKRKGDILSYFPGDEMHLVTAETITLPGFNPTAIPSADLPKPTANLNLAARHPIFIKDRTGDKFSKELCFDATIYNGTSKEYGFFDLSVLSDHGQQYFPALSMVTRIKQKVPPHTTGSLPMVFTVDSPKRKYWLVLIDRAHSREVARTEIN